MESKSFKKYAITGFSEDFLKSMGLKKVEFPLFEVIHKPVMPLELIELSYKNKKEIIAGSSSG